MREENGEGGREGGEGGKREGEMGGQEGGRPLEKGALDRRCSRVIEEIK